MQARYGPNRVGPFGALQPLADIVKLLTKEQFRPSASTGFLFTLAPCISIVTAVTAFAIIAFGNVQHIFGTPVGLYSVDVSIGPLYLLPSARSPSPGSCSAAGPRARSTRSSALCAGRRS